MEIQAGNVSKIIAVLIQRLGGEPQTIELEELEQFDRTLPTLFTIDPEKGSVTVEIQAPIAAQN